MKILCLQVLQIIDQEKAELDAQLSENEGCPELCFIEQSLELVNERKQDLLNRVSTNSYFSILHFRILFLKLKKCIQI